MSAQQTSAEVLATTRRALALALLGVVLAACGKRGPNEPPAGEADEYPNRYPRR
jgi:predicted small lipoprotein YifL